VGASGLLNVASIASVFQQALYKPLARLSGLLAIMFLLGGLVILVLDLGRPERLIVAMTHYNLKSIFAWNIFLYVGFILIVITYLVTMFEHRLGRYGGAIGLFAMLWRIVLTTGTGSIFGFLVARQAYDAAIMAPLFILMSLANGTAIFVLFWWGTLRFCGRLMEPIIVQRLGRLLAIFVAATLYLTLAYHLTNLYASEHHGVERFVLLEGGIYTQLFWVGQVAVGGAIPLLLLWRFATNGKSGIAVVASVLIVAGGLAQLYVIIIGGQAYPLTMFPGSDVTSSFFDGVVGRYIPSVPEFALGVGGAAFAILLSLLAMRILPFLHGALPVVRR
jgi:molybdopterin-containing oxidoreductase family membrane subunit